MNVQRAVGRLVGVTIAALITLSGPAGSGPADASGVARATALAGTGQPAAVSAGLKLSLTSVSPTAVSPLTDLVITGTARNTGTQPINNVQVLPQLRTPVLQGRTAIDNWLSAGALNGQASSFGLTPPGVVKLNTLAPGASRRFTITVPAGQLGLFAGSSFGPRALTIVARDKSHTLAGLRTTIVWAPGEQISCTRLSLLVPITETNSSVQAGQPTGPVANDLVAGGRLDNVLAATSDQAFSWAIDPAILTAAQRMAATGVVRLTDNSDVTDDPTGKELATPTPSAGANSGGPAGSTGSSAALSDAVARPQAQDWLSTFKAGLNGREVFGLPFADPDLTSLLSTKQSLSLLRHSDSLGATATQSVLGSSLDSTLAWPGEGKINTAAIGALGRTGRTAVVLASSDQRPSPAVDYTPSGRSTLRGSGKTLTGLLYDDQLSELVTTIGTNGPQTAAQLQTLLAQLAAITLELPDDTRQVLAVTPRSWNPDPAGVQALITALRAAPWVSLRNLSSLRKASAPPRKTPTYKKSAVLAQLPIGQITSALAMSRDLDTFAPALIDPTPVVEPLREQIASMLSFSWRTDRTQMSDQRIGVASKVNDLAGGVRLLVGDMLFTAHSSVIPLTVSNNTNYAVKVVVRLRPQSGQLIIDHPLTVVAPPHRQTPVHIPARAMANGNVVVKGELLTTTDLLLSTAPDFTVGVHPNWESRGMIGAATVLGLLFLVGLFRSIRRRRRPRVPLESVPDVDDLATRAAQVAHAAEGPAAEPTQAEAAAPSITRAP